MPSSRPELRIGDQERDAVAEILRDAVAEGRLTLDELEERLEAALAARTLAELDPLVADLPVDLPSESASAAPAATQQVRSRRGPGGAPVDPLVLDPGWAGLTRTGRWELPPYVRLQASHGVLRLDCLEATPLAPTIDVEVAGGSGSITVVVPDTWAVDRDRLQNRWGTAWIRVPSRPGPSRAGCCSWSTAPSASPRSRCAARAGSSAGASPGRARRRGASRSGAEPARVAL